MNSGLKTFLKNFICTVILSFLFIGQNVNATHIVGGELNYQFLGGDQYEIRLTVYRDCYNGVPDFDIRASLGVFNSNNQFIKQILLDYRGKTLLPPTINSPCFTPPIDVCYERTTYIDTISLPAISGGYKLAYQRCCRNQTIVNLVSPGETGATYFATVPPPLVVAQNSNPVFKNWPPPFLCANVPFSFDHSAIDYDGDSLVYEMFTPLHGASVGAPTPQPPLNPPYYNVTFSSPYSISNMLGGVALTIDPKTGLLTCTPNTLGQFVVGMKVKEYRNGVFLSETLRDFQFNVVNCPDLLIADINVSSSFSITAGVHCGTNDVNFFNNSFGASSYSWNFGDPSTQADTSNLYSPTYTYSDTGTFTVTLIGHHSSNPACNDTTVELVRIYPSFEAQATFGVLQCSNTVSFTDNTISNVGTPIAWNWTFGDGTSSTQQNPTHVFPGPGTYNSTLIVTTSVGCTDTVDVSVQIISVNSIQNVTATCGNFSPVFTNQSTGATNYLWDFGNGNTSNSENPSYTYPDTGTYVVTLIAISAINTGCNDTSYSTIKLYPPLIADFSSTVVQCSNLVNFSDLSNTTFGFANSWVWSFGDGQTSPSQNPVHTFPGAGTFNVQLISASNTGCIDTVNKSVLITIVNALASATSTCGNMSPTLSNNSTGANTYRWDFGIPGTLADTSIQVNPVVTYADTGLYVITLIASHNATGCRDTITTAVRIYPAFVSNFSHVFTACSNTVNFTDLSSAFGPDKTLSWNFGDENTSSEQNPSHTYLVSGTYTVTLNSGFSNGCQGSKTIQVQTTAVNSSHLSSITCGSYTPAVLNSSSGFSGYLWDFGVSGTSSDESGLANPTYTYTDTGTYSIMLIVYSPDPQCHDTSYTEVKIYQPPIPDFEIAHAPCSYEVSFSNLSNSWGQISNYLWLFGDGGNDTEFNTVHSYNSPGNYEPGLIVNSINGCSDTIYLPFNIPSIEIDKSGDRSVCDANPVQIFANGGVYYQWTPAEGLSSTTISNPTAFPNVSTKYYVDVTLVTTANDTCVVKDSMTVYVSDTDFSGISATTSKDTVISGQSTILQAYPGSLFYNWTPTTGIENASSIITEASPTVTTTYSVRVTDQYGCYRNASVIVYTIPLECAENDVFVPNTFTPNGDNRNDMLLVRGYKIMEVYFAVYNRWGEKVFETTDKFKGWDGTYNGMSADPGVFAYYVRAKCYGGADFIKKGNVTLVR